MAWTEVVEERTKRRKFYIDSEQPGRVAQTLSLARLHYESELDSGNYVAPINMTPQRVQTAVLDGWRVTNADYHFGLGLREDGRDGWVGFGGRQGAHQFWFRLERAGWVHWPTRTFTQVGGVANYNRANLTRETRSRTLPLGETLNLETVATWTALWPGVDVRWRMAGDKLKEEIVVSQATRNTLADTYPGGPLNETYLTFAFRLDLGDLPRIYKNEILQDLASDFGDDGTTPLLARDALDRLLFFLPLDDAIVYDDGVKLARTGLRKRIYSANGVTWLLIGLRADVLAGLPDGQLVFDPTIETDVAATADDGWCVGGSYDNDDNQLFFGDWFGSASNSFVRFTSITIPDGDTIDESYVQFTAIASNSATTVDLVVRAADSADAAAPISCAEFTNYTTATVLWNNVEAFVDGNLHLTPSLNTIFQELVDDNAGLSSAGVVVFILDNGSTEHRRASQFEFSAAEAAMLHIVHSGGGAGANLVRVLDEDVQTTESSSRIRSLLRNIAESETIDETILSLKFIIKIILDSIQIQETILRVRQLIKTINETEIINEVDLFLKFIVKIILDVLQVQETTSRVRQLVRSIGEVISVNETINRIRSIVRQITESLSVVEQINQLKALLKYIRMSIIGMNLPAHRVLPPAEDGVITLQDRMHLTFLYTGIVPSGQTLLAIIDNTVQIQESVTRLRLYLREINETISNIETVLRNLSLIRQIDSVVQIQEAVVRLRLYLREVNETVSSTEVVSRTLSFIRQIYAAIQIQENTVRFSNLVRLSFDLIQVSEVSGCLLSLRKFITETVSIDEQAIRVRSLIRRLQENVTIEETVGRITGLFRFIDESVQIIETNLTVIVTGVTDLVREISEGINIIESNLRLYTLLRSVTEVIEISHTSAFLRDLVRIITESVPYQEVIIRSRVLLRAIQETIQLSEVSSKLSNLQRIISESVQIVEGIVDELVEGITDLIRVVVEIFEIRDNINYRKNIFHSITESENVSELIQRNISYLRLLTEQVRIEENLLRIFSFVRTISEQIQLLEVSQTVRGFSVIVSEAVELSEQIVYKIAEAVKVIETKFRGMWRGLWRGMR